MTLAGLNTVNLSELNTFQQFILFLLIILGSAIFVSLAVVHIRRKAFERRFKGIVDDRWRQRKGRGDTKRRLSLSHFNSEGQSMPEVDGVVVRGSRIGSTDHHGEKDRRHSENSGDHPPTHQISLQLQERSPASRAEFGQTPNGHAADDADHEENSTILKDNISRRITFTAPTSAIKARSHTRILSMQGVGARQDIMNHPSLSNHSTYTSALPKMTEMTPMDRHTPWDFLPSSGSIGRNSQFSRLTLADREKLGGVEYRAVKFLAIIVPTYFVLWQFLGSIGLGAYISINLADIPRDNGLNPWYSL